MAWPGEFHLFHSFAILIETKSYRAHMLVCSDDDLVEVSQPLSSRSAKDAIMIRLLQGAVSLVQPDVFQAQWW